MDMNDAPFLKFVAHRDSWAVKDDYCNPGSVQFGGAGSWNTTLSLQIEKHGLDAMRCWWILRLLEWRE